MLESEYKHISTAQIARLYGLKFAKSLDDIALGKWQGPVKSGYGLHLVKIDEKSPSMEFPMAMAFFSIVIMATAICYYSFKNIMSALKHRIR